MMDYFQNLKYRLQSLLGHAKHIEQEIYTPRELVSGYIKSAPGLDPIEAAWHTASVTLETERIRLIHRLADDGIYFIAADAVDFIDHPDSKSPLSAALPGDEGHLGDGAYFVDIGYGSIAVIIKDAISLRCYVGDRTEVTQFASGYTAFWPDSQACDVWVGFRHLENRHVQRLAKTFVVGGVALTILFLAVAIVASWRHTAVAVRTDVAVQKIQAQEREVADKLNATHPDALAGYRNLIAPILEKDGHLLQVESTGENIKFVAELPSWVSASDIGALGHDLNSKVEGDHIVISKGF